MAANKKCPRCGAEIPEDAPSGTCPACALRDALGLGAYDAKNVDQGADTVPMHIDEKQRSRITQTIAFQRRLRKILFASRWIVAGVFIVVIGYVLVRHVWISGHMRPFILLNEDLSVASEIEQLGLAPQTRLQTVNGERVSTLGEVFRAYDTADRPVATFEFVDRANPDSPARELSYIEGHIPFEYEVQRDGTITLNDANALLASEISPTERVTAINGFPIEPLFVNEYVSGVPQHPDRQIIGYQRFSLSDNATGRERDVVAWLDDKLRQRARLLAGVGFLGIGLLVFWLKPDTRSSAGFLCFSAVLGIFYLARSIQMPYRLGFESTVYYLFQGLTPAAAAIMLFTFTPLRLLVRRTMLFAIGAISISLLFLMVNALQYPEYASVGLLSTFWIQVWAFGILILFLISLPLDWWLRFFKVPLSPTDKQRSRTLRLAFTLGLAPTVFYAALTIATMRWHVITPLVDVSVLIFPALLGYAIVRHNFLRLNELAREGVLYGLLMAMLSGFYVTGTSVVLPYAHKYLPDSAEWSQSVVLAGAMAAIIPVHTATRRMLEKRFKRIPFEFDQFLSAVESEGSEWHGPVDFCHMIATQLSRMVDTAHITVLTHYPNQDDWSISASTHPSDSETTSESCKMLCALLEQEKSEVFRDDVLEGFRYRIIQREILDGLEALDAAVVIPLVSRGHVIGAISLGDKSGNINYSAAELHTLKRIASHVAGTLYNLMTLTSFATGTRICDIWPDWPERIGGYSVERPIGEGGMAYVFLGRRDGKAYAIKVANRLVQSNSRLMERFHREASAIQRLNHPNIVNIVEVGWEGPEPFIVFEYFANGSLDQMVNPGDPLDIPSVISYGIQLTEALKYAHEQGVIHRDIKPRNIFLDDEFRAKVGDFGLAQISDRSTLTQKGEFFGTPDYLAPELLKGGKSSVQSDMYALGVTLFELAIGHRPFKGETAEAAVQMKLSAEAPHLSQLRPEIDSSVAAIVEKLLRRLPEERYASYQRLLSDWKEIQIATETVAMPPISGERNDR